MPYFEVIQILPDYPYIKTYTFDDVQEAASVARYLAKESGRETLLRKVTDVAYLSDNKADIVTTEWRLNYGITQVYKNPVY